AAHRMGRPGQDRAKGSGKISAPRLTKSMEGGSVTSRRTFLAAAGALTTAIAKPGPSPLMGLEIYSLRREAEKDLPATLALIRKFGFKEVEGGDFYGRTAAEFRKLLDGNGL